MTLFLIIYGIFILLIYLVSLVGLWYDYIAVRASVIADASGLWHRHQRFRFSMHHYFIAAIFIPWTGFFNPISAAIQGMLAGIFVEGKLSNTVRASLDFNILRRRCEPVVIRMALPEHHARAAHHAVPRMGEERA